MKLKSLLLLFVALLYLSYPVLSDGCGSNWLGNDAVGNDPDFNYAARVNGQTQSTASTASSTDSDVSSTSGTSASDSRPRIPPDERTVTAAASTGPNMSMPDPSPKPLVQAVENNTSVANADASNAGSEAAGDTEEAMDVGGKWTINLGDTGSYLDLIFIQSGDSVMGSGSLAEGSAQTPVIVSASLDGKELGLDVKSSVPVYEGNVNKEYKIELHLGNQTVSGTYEAYDNNKLVSKGNATASRAA